MRTSLLPATVALGLLLPALSLADIPIPGQPFRPRGPIERPEPAPETAQAKPVVVKRDALKHADIKDAKTIKAKIVIPRSLLPVVKEAPAKAPAAEPASKPPRTGSVSPTGTIVAGIALSLAAVSCVFLLRKNKAGRAAAVGVLVIAGALGVWSAAIANAPPPFRPVPNLSAPASPRAANKPASDSVILLEIVEEGDSITLVLPK